jgi:signal peptide peptidase SppA
LNLIPQVAQLIDFYGPWLIDADRFAAIAEILATFTPLEAASFGAVEKTPAAKGNKSIAIVRINGVMMKGSTWFGTSTIAARQQLRAASQDPEVSAILLAIDSPGGQVAGTSDLAAEVRAANKIKPVWSHIDDTGASAAYWVASQSARILANDPNADVGSIGTMQVVTDASGAAEKAGIKTIVIKTGPLKGIGVMGAPVTDAQISHLQDLANKTQANFEGAVAKGRGMSAKQIQAVNHGGVLKAPDALNAGLIDGIQPIAKTLGELSAAAAKPQGQRADAGGSLPMIRHVLPMLNN